MKDNIICSLVFRFGRKFKPLALSEGIYGNKVACFIADCLYRLAYRVDGDTYRHRLSQLFVEGFNYQHYGDDRGGIE